MTTELTIAMLLTLAFAAPVVLALTLAALIRCGIEPSPKDRRIP